MASETVVLDMADAQGAVISSLVPLSREASRTVLVLAHLLRVDATGGAIIRVRITNASANPLRRTMTDHESDRIDPGETFEVTFSERAGFAGMQLIADEAVATTLTISLCQAASGPHLLAQALVSG